MTDRRTDDGPQTPPAIRREPMPKRVCQGYQRACTTILSVHNMESICAICSYRRAEAIIEANEAYAKKRSHKRQDSCARGHEWSPANTKYRSDGSRQCRACRADSRARAAA